MVVRCFSLFLPEIYSERGVVFRRNPGFRSIQRVKKTAKGRLFRRCFRCFCTKEQREIVKIALIPCPNFGPCLLTKMFALIPYHPHICTIPPAHLSILKYLFSKERLANRPTFTSWARSVTAMEAGPMPKITQLCAIIALIGSSLPSVSSITNAQIGGAVQYPPPSVGEDALPPPPAGMVPKAASPRRIELGVSGSSQLPGSAYYQLRLRTGPAPFTPLIDNLPKPSAAPTPTGAGG